MELWLSNWWRSSTKSLSSVPKNCVIGILTFEIALLMLKVINLWTCLSDKKMLYLREEVITSTGIQKLVSNDEDHLMNLVQSEILECFIYLKESVVRLGKRCSHPTYHHLENIFVDETEIDLNWSGWEYNTKKMEKKIRKMKRFVAATSQLHQELQVMSELEQILRTMQAKMEFDQMKLLDFQRKVMWQHLEVESLQEMSLWTRTYDYTIRILLRSLFTIFTRIKYVFAARYLRAINCSNGVTKGCLIRSHSISIYTQTSVHPSESNSISRSVTNLPQSIVKNGPIDSKLKCHKHQLAETSFLSRTSLTNFPSTLSQAGLSLQYANIIISIEKLASSPNVIGIDERDKLYNMLPTSIRASMRQKLKLHAKSLGDSVKDDLVCLWSLKVARILGWLAPLAHNTMRWHSDRNFEKKRMISRLHVLLVQTLYFANREKTEAAITELLIGLSYISRFSR